MTSSAVDGLVTRPSRHSVDETLERLNGILGAMGVRVFALVDQSGEAAKVGMTMHPTKLLIFGNPTSGTPLMLASPSIAIDLPFRTSPSSRPSSRKQASRAADPFHLRRETPWRFGQGRFHGIARSVRFRPSPS